MTNECKCALPYLLNRGEGLGPEAYMSFVVVFFVVFMTYFMYFGRFGVRAMSACVSFGRFIYLLFLRVVNLLYRREACGSGARGLIKAPAGGVGERPHVSGCDLYNCFNGRICNSPLAKARGVWGVQHRLLLDLPVLTDTKGVGLGPLGPGGFSGVR